MQKKKNLKKRKYKILHLSIELFMLISIVLLINIFSAGCENNNEDYAYNSTPSVSPLSISPASVTLKLTDTYTVLTASGGTGPYSWTISDSSLGSIPETSAGTITYTRTDGTDGANVVNVFDQNHWSGTAIVNQNSETNSAKIKP